MWTKAYPGRFNANATLKKALELARPLPHKFAAASGDPAKIAFRSRDIEYRYEISFGPVAAGRRIGMT